MVLSNSNALLRRLPPFKRWIRSYRMMDDDFSQPRVVPQPSASCLLLRRSCLDPERVYDEQYPVYFNDVALAHKLESEGRTLWMTPDAAVVHEHGASTRLLGGTHKRQHLGALVRYLKATQPRPQVLTFQTFAFVQGVVPRALRRSGSLSMRDLLGAVSGDPGPLPRAAAPPDEPSKSEADEKEGAVSSSSTS
jgi:hypothetical protein